jgi:CubicO group peptidase (beta-lactamase class C family)
VNTSELEYVSNIFYENFEDRGELGASVSIWRDGEEILELAYGFRDREKREPWKTETRVLVWSATKGPAAACALQALESRGLDLDARVSDVWPGFARAGKKEVTFGQVLSHQAGLAALDENVDVFDHDAVVAALEMQQPAWEPGTMHGYHPRTFGFLLDEIVRALTLGQTLGSYWREHFAQPLGLDFWIGLPEELVEHTATVFAARTGTSQTAQPSSSEFLRAFTDASSLTARSFSSPKGLHAVAAMNTPAARKASLPGFGGVGTAVSLGKFYAMLANDGVMNGRRCVSQTVLDWMQRPLVNGPDEVLRMDTSFSAGFMKDPVDNHGGKTRAIFGPSLRAFGQPGAGGSLGFADPADRIAFAYVMNQMEQGVLPGEKSLQMVRALYGEPVR